MKRIFTILAAVFLTASVFAQSPEKMSYQAVIHNNSDQLVKNTQIGIKVSIQKFVLGMPPSFQNVYVETHTPTTNQNGLVSLQIGDGTVVGGVFSNIDWSDGEYYIKTEIDPTGGTNYSISGRSQLLSVPYALHAKNVKTYKVGNFAQGGIVFWVDETGQHGLVCDKNDLTETSAFWCPAVVKNTIAKADGIYAGKTNTMLIIAGYADDGDPTYMYPARACNELNTGQYGDWYLPSITELLMMYSHKDLINATAIANGGSAFLSNKYWSSNEKDVSSAYCVDFSDGSLWSYNKLINLSAPRVRAVRAF